MDNLVQIHGGREDCYRILDDASYPNDVNLLHISGSRRKTDNSFLVVFAVCAILMLPCVIYTLYYSDINRLKGYDKCGNICGQENVRDYRWSCTGQDMTLKPIYYADECITMNDNSQWYSSIDGEALFTFFRKAVWKIVLVSFVPVALCLIMVVLFRYAPSVAIWGILILSWLFFTIGFIVLLIIPVNIVAIPFSILVMMKLWILFFDKTKIREVTKLMKEATRGLFEVKMMSYISIGALPVLMVILLVYSTITFYSMTAGKLIDIGATIIPYSYYGSDVSREVKSTDITCRFDGLMLTTIILGSIITFWTIQIVAGAQDMTVSASIAKWYTTKNLDHLPDDAVPSSLHVTLYYHLGTIVLGSAIKTVIFIPRVILVLLTYVTGTNDRWMRCVSSIFTNKLYIITAIHGTSFIQSAKKVVKVLRMSNGNTADVVSFGNSVIVLGQIVVISISTLLAFTAIYFANEYYGVYSLSYSFYFAFIEFGIATICSHTILGTIKVSTNTLFFCASEELLRNKEVDLPFAMTMREFCEGSNRVLLHKIQSRTPLNIPEKSFYIKLFSVIFVCISCVMFIVAYFI